VLALLDVALLFRFPLTRYVPVVEARGAAIGIVEIFGDDRQTGSWFLISVVTGQFFAYGIALAAVQSVSGRAVRWVVYGVPVVFAALLMDLYPISTVDMFHYLASARTFWVYGDNPLTVSPMTHSFPVAMSYGDYPSPYGPLWTLLTLPAARLSEIDPTQVHVGLLGIKGMAAISYLGSIWLVARIAGHLSPGRELLAVVAFGWNPFIVFRVVGNGGNGLVMMGLVLMAALFVVRGRWRWVMPALTAAVLIKYIPLLLIPPLVVYVLRLNRDRGDRRPLTGLLQGTAIAALGTIVIWIPFWDGWKTVAIVDEIDAMYTSTPGALAYQLRFWLDAGDPAARARQGTALLYGAIYALLLWRIWRGPANPARLLVVWYLVFFLFLSIAAPFVFPWYFLWFAALGPVLPGIGYLLLTAVATYTVSLVDPLWAYVEYVPWVQDGFGRMVAAPVVLQSVPAGLCLLALLARYRSLLLRDMRTEPLAILPEPHHDSVGRPAHESTEPILWNEVQR
jgi:hypothetical protein